ncbi:MAG TPA: hypothetical protein DD979_01075 [Gammaproteobacteria bacterium]|nr:hypothetical protein [Gammaproteobacteria bacterium]
MLSWTVFAPLRGKGKLVPIQALEQIFRLRLLAVPSQIITIALVHYGLEVHLRLDALGILIAVELVIALLTRWRSRTTITVSEIEVFLHMSVDVALLGCLLYFTGGFTNPFVSLLLFYIALSATLLSTRYCIAITLLTVIWYSGLVLFYHPLIPRGGRFVDEFDLHLAGMWVNFILSALLMTGFVTALVKLARDREEKLARAREKMLRNEHLLLLGTLSASVAHELNTPLSSIRMLLGQLERDATEDPWTRDQILRLREQTDHCITRIRELTDVTKEHPDQPHESTPMDRFADSVVRRWSAMRPEIQIDTRVDGIKTHPLQSPGVLSKIVINLLNNAADASLENASNQVTASFCADFQSIRIVIDDRGKGITERQLAQAGKIVESSKSDGLGIGLMLSHATLEVLGGTLLLRALPNGTRAEITIPSIR